MTMRLPLRCLRYFSLSLRRCIFSMTRMRSAASSCSALRMTSAPRFSPALSTLMFGCSQNIVSAVGLRRRFMEHMKRRFLMEES